MDLQGKKVLVFGAGISGIGSCGLLEKEGAEVILYDGNDKKDAEAVADKLCTAIRSLSTLKPEWSEISASIGISFADRAEIEMEELYIAADKAMYSSKGNGRNQYQIL